MGISSYNRGSHQISVETDIRMSEALAREENRALKDKIQFLNERIVSLESELSRARRCIASERNGRASLELRLAQLESIYGSAVSTLCRRAFPEDRKDEE